MSPEAHLAEQFGAYRAQKDAARLGMWIFIGTEILLFGGLFCAYAMYRAIYPAAFHAASRHMDVTIGTVNTYVLLVSSVFVALALSWIRKGRELLSTLCLVAAILLGLTFLVLKGVEYAEHAKDHVLPGVWYAVDAPRMPGASLFITLYFLMTGLHAIHMTVAVGVLTVLAFRSAAGQLTPDYHQPLELGAMYWHLVDVIWVFLYPMFYLLAR
jgi:cytochrome c oxidase subunit 3